MKDKIYMVAGAILIMLLSYLIQQFILLKIENKKLSELNERLERIEEVIGTSDNSEYEAALHEIIDRYLYNAGAKAPTIDACIKEIQRLNASHFA